MLTIALNDDATLTVSVYPEGDADAQATTVLPLPAGRTWRFRHWIWGGTAYIADYRETTIATTTTTTQSYNAANQVVGWSYDAAGNLLTDGTTTYGYDALNRLVTQDGTTNTYNGDGVLVQRGTTQYAQDLVAPLSQVLTDGTDTYVYGHERLTALGQTWYIGDALGSVRQTLDSTGAVQATANYAPFGEPQGSSIAPFGFTGELQDQGLVNLRARWYDPSIGTFTAVDPFAGFPEMPYSLHPYQYAYGAPTTWTDPSGERVYRIWAAAFIKPAQFLFPHFPAQGGIGSWHGDGRDFTIGQYKYNAQDPRSRVWHEIVLDIAPEGTIVKDSSTDTGETIVDYLVGDSRGMMPPVSRTDRDKAPKPKNARIDTSQPCITTVSITVGPPEGKNPLAFGAPSIRYEYNLTFNLLTGMLHIRGQRSRFPWQELYIEAESGGVLLGQAPLDVNPGLLAYPDLPIPEKIIPIPRE